MKNKTEVAAFKYIIAKQQSGKKGKLIKYEKPSNGWLFAIRKQSHTGGQI